MNTRIITEASRLISNTTSFIASYLSPLSQQFIQMLRARVMAQIQQRPLALPAPPPVLLLMPAPAAPAATNDASAAPEKKKKKKRATTKFDENVTASASLANKQIPAPVSSSITSLFYSTATKIKNWVMKTPPTDPITLDEEATRTEMRRLQSLIDGHPDPDSIVLQQIELVSGQIRLHAQMRVQLFLHLLLAVRGTHYIVSKGSTIKQHGKGDKKANTQACHSFIIPHVVLTESAHDKHTAVAKWSLFGNNKKSAAIKPSLQGLAIDDMFNITFEMPAIVNEFDCHLEGTWQKSTTIDQLIEVANKVSRNEIDIIAGMNEFLLIMHSYFNHIWVRYMVNQPDQITYPQAFKRVWACERMGTFDAAIEGKLEFDVKLLYSTLRIFKLQDIAKFKLNPDSYYDSFQKEIFESVSDYEQAKAAFTSPS